MTAEKQKKELIRLLSTHLVSGLNSKVFYNEELYRFAERFRELRVRDNWVFAKIKEPVGGHNLIRMWIVRSPDGKIDNLDSIPKGATLWGRGGKLNKWELGEIKHERKILSWRFEGTNAFPVYA